MLGAGARWNSSTGLAQAEESKAMTRSSDNFMLHLE